MPAVLMTLNAFLCTIMYRLYLKERLHEMKTVIPISEARKRLPGIIKSLRKSPDTVYQVTVHNEVVAEIKSPPALKPGEAAAGLLKMRKKLKPKRRGYKLPMSENIKEHLYVAEGKD